MLPVTVTCVSVIVCHRPVARQMHQGFQAVRLWLLRLSDSYLFTLVFTNRRLHYDMMQRLHEQTSFSFDEEEEQWMTPEENQLRLSVDSKFGKGALERVMSSFLTLNNTNSRLMLSVLNSQTSCAVCLGDYDDDDPATAVTYLKGCLHTFHKTCFKRWKKVSENFVFVILMSIEFEGRSLFIVDGVELHENKSLRVYTYFKYLKMMIHA